MHIHFISPSIPYTKRDSIHEEGCPLGGEAGLIHNSVHVWVKNSTKKHSEGGSKKIWLWSGDIARAEQPPHPIADTDVGAVNAGRQAVAATLRPGISPFVNQHSSN